MKLPQFVNNENVTLALISVGLPAIALLYFSWKEAVSVAVIVQIVLGILRIRNS